MASNSRSRNCPTPPSMPLLSLASYLICVQKMSPCSLVPRPLSDFISQPWRNIGRRPGIKTTSRTGNGGLGQYVTWTRFVLTESTISQHDVTQHNVTQHDVAICESFLRKILGRVVLWHGKSVQSAKVFSATIVFFTNLWKFLPRKFFAIRYAILTKYIARYYHIWKY